jgi:hypothetical protein
MRNRRTAWSSSSRVKVMSPILILQHSLVRFFIIYFYLFKFIEVCHYNFPLSFLLLSMFILIETNNSWLIKLEALCWYSWTTHTTKCLYFCILATIYGVHVESWLTNSLKEHNNAYWYFNPLPHTFFPFFL